MTKQVLVVRLHDAGLTLQDRLTSTQIAQLRLQFNPYSKFKWFQIVELMVWYDGMWSMHEAHTGIWTSNTMEDALYHMCLNAPVLGPPTPQIEGLERLIASEADQYIISYGCWVQDQCEWKTLHSP